MAMHDDQIDLPSDVAEQLIRYQFPQWNDLAVRRVATEGTVNAIFRIGDRFAARFPLRAEDPDQLLVALESEANAALELATCSPVPVPEPVAMGAPGPGYPLPWRVQTWLPGETATIANPAGSFGFAEDLARFISALRKADTRGRRFSGEGRGGHLPDHDEWLDICFEESDGLLDTDRVRALWNELRTLPKVGREVMSHGDLVPGNVLVRDGRLTGVLDAGGFAPADPALDLVAAWHLLDTERRAHLRDLLHCGDIEWRRGMAWAFQQAMGLVWYYIDSNPPMSRLGRRTLDRILAAA